MAGVGGRYSLDDWALLLLLSLMWGTAFTFTKVAVTALPPAVVVVSRLAVGAALLLVAIRFTDLRLPPWGWIWARFTLLAVFGNALPFFLITWGQRGIDSGLAGTLLASMPLATLFLAHFFVVGERLTRAKTAGFTLGLFGVGLLLRPDVSATPGNLHQLAVVAGALCYAVNAVLARRMPAVHPAISTAATLTLATFMVLPAAVFALVGATSPPPRAWFALLWLGVVATAAATIVYFRIIASAGPTFLSLINYLIPVVALLAGMAVLGEQPGWGTVFPLGVILAGLALATR